MLKNLIGNQQGRMPVWLGVVIIIIALVIIALLIVWMNQPAETPANPETGTTPAEVQEFHTVIGRINAVTKNQIQILVLAKNTRLNADKVYKVNFDDSTEITKRKLPDSLESGEQVVINAEPGDVTELVTNINVVVTTEADLSKVDEFFATSIELRN